jgi:hypothetical protein
VLTLVSSRHYSLSTTEGVTTDFIKKILQMIDVNLSDADATAGAEAVWGLDSQINQARSEAGGPVEEVMTLADLQQLWGSSVCFSLSVHASTTFIDCSSMWFATSLLVAGEPSVDRFGRGSCVLLPTHSQDGDTAGELDPRVSSK